MAGWISLDRSITNHWLWSSEKFTKAQAWVDLLLWAAHTPHKVLMKGVLIPVARGEQIRSQVSLAKAWGWDRKTVSRFLKLLEKDQMISTRVDHLTSYISICNYDSFQSNSGSSPQPKGQVKGQQERTKRDTINNDNNDNNENNIMFERFWNEYDNKKGKDKCQAKFNKLSEAEKEKIFESLPDYVASTPDKKYRKNPLTWLNGKHWNDEIDKASDYDYVISEFNNAMQAHANVKQASMMNQERISKLKALYAISNVNKENLGDYFRFIAGCKDFDDHRSGNSSFGRKDLTWYLSDKAYQIVKEAK